MTHSFKIAVLTLSGFALCGAAFAERATFQANFTFNKAISVEANYANFERAATKQCRVDVRQAGGVGGKAKIEADCKTRLLADAVAASGKADLIALHAQRTGKDVVLATAH